MAITTLTRTGSYAPDSGKWVIITTALATPLTPLSTDFALSTTFDVTAAVASASNWMTSRAVVSDTEWGSTGIPFTSPLNKTIDGIPTLEFWADSTGLADIRASISEMAAVNPTVVWLPNGTITATHKAEVWTVRTISRSLTKDKGAHARVRYLFSVVGVNEYYTLP